MYIYDHWHDTNLVGALIYVQELVMHREPVTQTLPDDLSISEV